MKINYLTKNYKAGRSFKALKANVNNKLDKVANFAGEGAECTVTFTKTANTETMDITLITRTGHYRSQEQGANMFSNIDGAVSKILNQLVKDKEKRIDARTSKSLNSRQDLLDAQEAEEV